MRGGCSIQAHDAHRQATLIWSRFFMRYSNWTIAEIHPIYFFFLRAIHWPSCLCSGFELDCRRYSYIHLNWIGNATDIEWDEAGGGECLRFVTYEKLTNLSFRNVNCTEMLQTMTGRLLDETSKTEKTTTNAKENENRNDLLLVVVLWPACDCCENVSFANAFAIC